jgi:AbrB family looped-hinge helix DNA binding protein
MDTNEHEFSGGGKARISHRALECSLTKTRLACFFTPTRICAVSNATKSQAVRFTTKGRVVIPSWLRKQFHIKDGTKVFVEATPDGILLKPVTVALINRGRGILKRQPRSKSFAEEWAEHKAEEIALEEAKYARCTGGS